MERCPNCGARLTGGDGCRRCGLGLASLLAAERSADWLIRTAVARLAAGDADGAAHALESAGWLRRDPLVDHMVGFVRAEAVVQGLAAEASGEDPTELGPLA